MPDETPPRPASVPETAEWVPMHAAWKRPLWSDCPRDQDGKKHGLSRKWTPEGLKLNEVPIVHGVQKGPNIVFHPDGTIASVGTWVDGVLYDTIFYRSDALTTHEFAQDAGPNVWSAEFCSRNGVTNYTQRYFTREGTEVASSGEPLPARPAEVPADARYVPGPRQWVLGEIVRATGRQVGGWKSWTHDGRLLNEVERDDAGNMLSLVEHALDGAIAKRERYTVVGGKSKRVEQETFHPGGKPHVTRRSDETGRPTYVSARAADGTLEKETTTTYDAAGLASVRELGAGGRPLFEAQRDGAGLRATLFDASGTTQATGAISNGKLVGVWRIHGAAEHEIDATPYALATKPTHEAVPHALGALLLAHWYGAGELPAQLAGAADVPWHELRSCYTVPQGAFERSFRGLVSREPLARNAAFSTILRYTLHQGTIYETTARAIPFLVRALAHPAAERRRILAALRWFGDGARPHAAAVASLPEDNSDRRAVLGTLDALGAAWPMLWELVQDADAEQRAQIVVLAKYARGSSRVRDDLAKLAREGDAVLRACAIDTLADLDGTTAADLEPFLGDTDVLVRVAAATAAGLRFGRACSDAQVAPLEEVVHEWRPLVERFAALPYVDGHLLSYVALAAGRIRTERAKALLPVLCARLEELAPIDAFAFGRGVLALALGNRDDPAFAPHFVDALSTLAGSRAFFGFNVNAGEVLQAFNLPRTQRELQQLVADLRTAPDPAAALCTRLGIKLA